MISHALLLAAATVPSLEAAPAKAADLLHALETDDLAAARATFADEVTIIDATSGGFVESTVEALAGYVRGCARTNVYWDVDAAEPDRAAVSVDWTCPQRGPGQAFIWTAAAGVVHVQFGLPPMQQPK